MAVIKAQKLTCTRRIQFCAGHRVYRHESKCQNLHGHNYVALITCRTGMNAIATDAIGRVIDFGVVKEKVGGWIEANWDHRFLIYEGDPMLDTLKGLPGVISVAFNPTAELMAIYLQNVADMLLAGDGIEVESVRVWETENCYADYEVLDVPSK